MIGLSKQGEKKLCNNQGTECAKGLSQEKSMWFCLSVDPFTELRPRCGAWLSIGLISDR